ncbi:MAG TPA: hypothetical protein VJN96_11275 [Vicinamibacterales bacterium]|nr:hypothetical protein [Vicinamibacterales bacterium]
MTRLLAAVWCLVATAGAAHAQTLMPVDGPPKKTHDSAVANALLFLGGAAAGLGIHETGHVIFSATFDANPRVEPLHYGFIPFFKIEHDLVPRRQEFVISSAGFWMQYWDSEWILTARPNLRHEDAPFLKGILAFDLGASTVYSIAAFGRFGPFERDTRGMADSLGQDGWPEPVVGVVVLAPAVLDGYRYFHPESQWAKWASRGAKIASVVLVAASGR